MSEQESIKYGWVKRTALYTAWMAPGVIAVLPYTMQPPDAVTVGAVLNFHLGVLPWLWDRPFRLLMMVPTLVFLGAMIRRVTPHGR